MKILIRTLVFHFVCIVMFSLLYLNTTDGFVTTDNKVIEYVDCLLFSTTIQAGVGITNIVANSQIGKYLMILQQITLISTHAFTLYIFTL